MEVAAVRLHAHCFSPGNSLFLNSIPFKTGLSSLNVRERVGRANGLVVCVSSAVLSLQEPVDSALRPFLQTDIEFEVDKDEDKDCQGGKPSLFEYFETFARTGNGTTAADWGDSGNGSNEVPCRYGSSNAVLSSSTNAEVSSKLDERERLRRERIGLANKGNVPWNKGKHHSPGAYVDTEVCIQCWLLMTLMGSCGALSRLETIARMKERGKIAMQDPKVRERLRQYSHPQSEETREKIRRFMKSRMNFERRQLTIVQEWKDCIANMARKGMVGDAELQWDSYRGSKKELQRQYYAAKRSKEKDCGPKVLQAEHRTRISESLRAKWADSEYRDRVIQRIQETRKKRETMSTSNFTDLGSISTRETISTSNLADLESDLILDLFASSSNCSVQDYLFSQDAKVGSYSDPLYQNKLKKIKLLRLQNNARDDARAKSKALVSELTDFETNKEMIAGTLDAMPNGLSTQRVDLASLQEAQHEAAERARILLVQAEQAALFAAQALDAAGGCDVRLNESLLETWTLLDEASKFITLNANKWVDELT